MANRDDFLKPESMLTPGFAGGIAMMITNTLYHQFAFDQKITCLIISFALGGLVFMAKDVKLHKKALCYFLNSLIIFSMAIGANNVGVNVTSSKSPNEAANHISQFFISDAIAQEDVNTTNAESFSSLTDGEKLNRYLELNKKIEEIQKEQKQSNIKNSDQKIKKYTSPGDSEKERRFFSEW